MDRSILDHARENAALEALQQSIRSAAIPMRFCAWSFTAIAARSCRRGCEALEHDLVKAGLRCGWRRAMSAAEQARIWSFREAALGLSMAMKGDAKSLSFVEDTAVAPEKLSDYIERFLQIVRRHGTSAGVYAHASVGCLHVRPVVNLKTEEGVRRFEAIANEIADLVLEFGGALSGEHGDGLVAGPFMREDVRPGTVRRIPRGQADVRSQRGVQPGQNRRLAAADREPPLRRRRIATADPANLFRLLRVRRHGTAPSKCAAGSAPAGRSSMARCARRTWRRARRNIRRAAARTRLRLAMAGTLGESGLGDRGVYEVLDLCLECRACKSECPVGVDVARFKSEFLADYWRKNGVPWRAKAIAHIHVLSKWGSSMAPLSNRLAATRTARWLGEKLLQVDRRRALPNWTANTLAQQMSRRPQTPRAESVVLFNDTFTNYCHPEIGIAAVELIERTGIGVRLAPHGCCGRPMISQGLLKEARALAEANARALAQASPEGAPIVFLEPSCLSAVREDAPALVRTDARALARNVADRAILFEDFLEREWQSGRIRLPLRQGPSTILLHGHCHQKAMGSMPSARALLSRVPSCTVTELDAGCCGMAGSFGYAREHYEVSREIGERRLFPAARGMTAGAVLVASGISCRQQVAHFTGVAALHPATILRSLIERED